MKLYCSGVYLIHPTNLVQGPWKVYCDMQTEGGGWMVFQVRDDVEPRENFMRNWEDYKVGFGDFDREFWLGESVKCIPLGKSILVRHVIVTFSPFRRRHTFTHRQHPYIGSDQHKVRFVGCICCSCQV